MFANAIKIDAIVSFEQKITKVASKPRMASIQEGEDDLPPNAKGLLGCSPTVETVEQKTSTTICFDASIPEASHYNFLTMLRLGSFRFEVSPMEPKKDTVKPNFRTPPKCTNIGSISCPVK